MKTIYIAIYNHQQIQKGSVIVITAISLFLLIGLGALAIDVGYLFTTRAELQNVADAGALAGARELGQLYFEFDPLNQVYLSKDASDGTLTITELGIAKIHSTINEIASQNSAGNKYITINTEDIKIGVWDSLDPTNFEEFEEEDIEPDAVAVIARRDSTSAEGPIDTFFAKIFDMMTMEVEKEAIAALSGPTFAGKGIANAPFGFSEDKVFPDTTFWIEFSPTGSSLTGWHNYDEPKVSADFIGESALSIIKGDGYGDEEEKYAALELTEGEDWLENIFDIKENPGHSVEPEEVPEVSAGDEFNFTGGGVESLVKGGGGYIDSATYDGDSGSVLGNEEKPIPIIAMYDYFRYRDGDDNNDQWTTVAPVYKQGDNLNPSNKIEIVGFIGITITGYDFGTGFKAKIGDFTAIESRGGQNSFGKLKGTIPSLVK